MKLRPKSTLPILGLLAGFASAVYGLVLVAGAGWAWLGGGVAVIALCLVADL